LLVLLVGVWYARLSRASIEKDIFPAAVVRVMGSGGFFTLNVDVADTNERLRQALLRETPAVKGQGMLLVYPEPTQYGFEFKNLKVPVSVAFFDQGGVIRSIQLLQPCRTGPCGFDPGLSFKGVLVMDSSYVKWSALVLGYRVIQSN